MTLDLRAKVKICPFRACAMHPAIIIGTASSLWTWLWGRHHVPQNVFLVQVSFTANLFSKRCTRFRQHCPNFIGDITENILVFLWTHCILHGTQ